MGTNRQVLVTGGTGFLGQHVVARLKAAKADVYTVGRNLLMAQDVTKYFTPATARSDVVHLAYPSSQGIQTSVDRPFSQLLAPILRMDLNVIEACARIPVAKLLCVGSVCEYPEYTRRPTDESQLWAGYPEPVNAAYGLAKRMQIASLHAVRQEYGLHGIHLILANMYGPGDRSGHVIPALITKVRRAVLHGGPVVVWGHPEVTRSFLYVEDAAEGVYHALMAYDSPEPLNLVARGETSMETLIAAIADRLHYQGVVQFDTSHPTGHRRRSFDNTRLRATLNWEPQTLFLAGLDNTIRWQVDHVPVA